MNYLPCSRFAFYAYLAKLARDILIRGNLIPPFLGKRRSTPRFSTLIQKHSLNKLDGIIGVDIGVVISRDRKISRDQEYTSLSLNDPRYPTMR